MCKKKKSVLASCQYRIIRTMAAPGSNPFTRNRSFVALINYCGNDERSRRPGHVFTSSLMSSPCFEIKKHCLIHGKNGRNSNCLSRSLVLCCGPLGLCMHVAIYWGEMQLPIRIVLPIGAKLGSGYLLPLVIKVPLYVFKGPGMSQSI
jgi:hypothetical protein